MTSANIDAGGRLDLAQLATVYSREARFDVQEDKPRGILKVAEGGKMGKLLQEAAAQRLQREQYIAAAERAIDHGRFGRARRLFRLADYARADIITFYDEDTADSVYGEPEA